VCSTTRNPVFLPHRQPRLPSSKNFSFPSVLSTLSNAGKFVLCPYPPSSLMPNWVRAGSRNRLPLWHNQCPPNRIRLGLAHRPRPASRDIGLGCMDCGGYLWFCAAISSECKGGPLESGKCFQMGWGWNKVGG